MNTVDRRVVEMQFNNKDFEENIHDSIESLKSLKDSLDLTDSAKCLSAFERTAKNLRFDHLEEQASSLTARFSGLDIIVKRTFENVADAIWNCAAKTREFMNQFTIEPIFSGFEEYETQINSIQTILANTKDAMVSAGYTEAQQLDIVNDRLNQLNHYADKTIYNFTQMTNSIGAFTAAGVDLDTSVNAIQGIANMAAISGATSNQASSAMYMLSQAIAGGRLQAYHWNSLVHNSMGSKVFQDALVRTATAMGISAKALVDEKGFKDSLTEGWLTADVLTRTLEQFSWDFEQMAKDTVLDDATKESLLGRMKELYIGKGDNEATALEKARAYVEQVTDLSIQDMKEIKKAQLLAEGYTLEDADAIIQLAEDAMKAATQVTTFTKLMDTLKEAAQSGWTQTWQYIIGDFNQAKDFFTSISDYFSDIINASADARNELVRGWSENGGRDDLIAGFWNIVESIRNVVGTIKTEFRNVFPPATSEQLLNVTKIFRSMTEDVRAFTENAEKMAYVRALISGVAKVLSAAKSAAEYLVSGFKKLLKANFSLSESIQPIIGSVLSGIVKMNETVLSSEIFQSFAEWGKSLLPELKKNATSAFDTIRAKLRKVAETLNETDLFDKAGEKIVGLLKKVPKLSESFVNFGQSVFSAAKKSELLNSVWASIKAAATTAWQVIKRFQPKIKELFNSISELNFGEFFSFKTDDTNQASIFTRVFEKVKAVIQDAFENWQSTAQTCWEKTKQFFENLFTVTIPSFFSEVVPKFGEFLEKAFSVLLTVVQNIKSLLLAVSILNAAKGFMSLGSGLKNIGKGFKSLAKGFKEISENGLKIKNIKKESLGSTFLKIASAIGILVASIYVLAKMDDDAVKKGLTVISILAAELLGISLLFKTTGADGKSFLMIAAAVTLLLIPIKQLAAMPFDEAKEGILRLGIILTELALFMRIAGSGFSGKTGFIGLAVAVTVLTYAIKKLGEMAFGDVAQGIAALGALLLELGVFLRATSGVGKVSGLIGMSVAIGVMVLSLKELGKMKFSAILKSLVALGGIMTAFAIIAKSASGIKMGGALALLLGMAGALALFVYAFKEIEGSDLDGMLEFSLSIAAVLLALSASMKIMSGISIGAAIQGAVGLAAAMAIIAAAIYGIVYVAGLLARIDGSVEFINKAGDFLEAVGSAIGRFVGGIYGGVLQGINLPQIGTDLSSFMTNLDGFLSGCRRIDDNLGDKVGVLCGALLAIVGTELINGLVTLGEYGSVKQFASDIETLGKGLVKFGKAILPLILVPKGVLNRSVDLAKALSEIAETVSSSTSFVEILMGNTAFGMFAENVGDLGIGLTKFGFSALPLALVPKAATDRAIDVATSLAGISAQLSRSARLLELTREQTAFGMFAENVGDLGAGLCKFGFSTLPLLLIPKSATDKAIDVAISLAGISAQLSAAETFYDWFSKNTAFGTFAENIGDVGRGLSEFGLSVIPLALVPKAATDRAIDVATSLAGISAQLSESETLFDWLSDNTAFGTFAEDIKSFGIGLKSFVTEVRKIKYDEESDKPNLDGVIAVAESLAAFEQKLNSTGGMWQMIFGEKDLGKFAQNIRSLGTALGEYLTAIATVNVGDSTSATTVLDDINTFIDTLDESGGLFQKIDKFFNGSKHETLKNFSGMIGTLGSDLNSFSAGTQALKSLNFDPMESIATLLKSIDENFGEGSVNFEWWNKLNEEWQTVNLAGQAKNLGDFGDHFKRFSDGLANAPVASVNFDTTRQIFKDFIAFNDEISGLGNIVISDNFKTIGKQFSVLGSYVDSFTNYFTSETAETAANGAEAIFKLVQSLVAANGLEDTSIDNLLGILTNFEGLILPTWETIGTDSGSGYMAAVCTGVQNGVEQFQLTIQALTRSGADAANEAYQIYYDAGQNLAIGMANGILSMCGALGSAGASAAVAGIVAVKETWDEHSPSKVGDGLGVNFDLGLIGGILRYKQRVADSTGSVAESAVDVAKAMLLGINTTLPNDLDITPTIRPVVDLSNAQKGADRIAGMFGDSQLQQLGLFQGGTARVNLEGIANISARGEEMTDRNIVAHLEALEYRMGDLGDRILNMQVVLDSGETVGALGHKMDKTLGTIATRRERAN